MRAAIEARDLTKYYPLEGVRSRLSTIFNRGESRGKLALDRVSLRVYEGEVFGFLGPNGAGKSTFIKILSTILLPTEGKAYVFGYDVVKEPMAVRKLIGVMPEIPDRGFYRRLSLKDNLAFYGRIYGVQNPVREAERLIKEYGLEDVSRKWFQKLSRGEKQKASLLRALISRAPLLLLDEPTLGLDVVSARMVKRRIREKFGRPDLTVFLTTHNLAVAEEVCDRVGIINKGRIIAVDRADRIVRLVQMSGFSVLLVELDNPKPGVLEAIKGLDVVLKAVELGPGRYEVTVSYNGRYEALNIILETLVRMKCRLRSVRFKELSLEEAFIKIVEGDEFNA